MENPVPPLIPVMKCGCAANAKQNGADVCVIHGCSEVAPNPPDLTGRKAICSYYPNGGKYGKCEEPRPSSPNLAFFKHQQAEDTDSYYCGCWGFD